jgi:hypothetical protein
MNIININSDIEINHAQKSFLEEVLFSGDNHHMIEEDSFFWLSKTIPIFLINEKSMQKYEKDIGLEYRYELNPEIKPHTEWLGFYGRDSAGLFEHTPRIAICTERIAQCVNTDEEFIFLLAIVVVHEFAHAKMDFRDENIKYRSKDTFWHWMEESMANQLTLEVFQEFSRGYHHRYRQNSYRNKSWEDDLFNFVVDFTKHQPPAYALGYEIFDKRIRQWWIWRSYKDELGGQKRIKQKDAWLQYVQSNYKNIDEKITENLYEKLFK